MFVEECERSEKKSEDFVGSSADCWWWLDEGEPESAERADIIGEGLGVG